MKRFFQGGGCWAARAVALAVSISLGGPLAAQSGVPERVGAAAEAAGAAADAEAGAAGGAMMADFDSLMELIQSTVVPETWEELGGPSTMSPYPGGIAVEAQGTLGGVVTERSGELRRRRAEALEAPADANADWHAPAALRKVSLTRLREAVQARLETGEPLTPAMQHFAGLSRISHVFVADDGADVVLAGTVGGVVGNPAVGPVDAKSGWPSLRLDDFALVADAVLDGRSLGCSIDPTEDGMKAAMEVARRIAAGGVPAAQAADALAEAIGPQDVRVFGVARETPLALALVAVDVHMKRLALDREELPPGVSSYFDLVADTLDEGLPDGDVLRLWFAPRGVTVQATPDGRAMQWEALPVQLMSERQWADAAGRRAPAGRDARAEHFATTLTARLESVVRAYPLYGRMTAALEMALVCELTRRNRLIRPESTLGILARPDDWLEPLPQAPHQVESLVAQRSIREGRKRHQVTVVSGGVQITAASTVGAISTDRPRSPQLTASEALADAPPPDGPWWWD